MKERKYPKPEEEKKSTIQLGVKRKYISKHGEKELKVKLTKLIEKHL